jgi:hypothetical protein
MNTKINHLINVLADEDVKGKTIVYNIVNKLNGKEVMEYKEYKYLMKKEALERKQKRTMKILSSLNNQIVNLEEYKAEKDNEGPVLMRMSVVPTETLDESKSYLARMTILDNELKQQIKDNERIISNEHKMRMFYEDKISFLTKTNKLESVYEDEKHNDDDHMTVNDEIMNDISELKECVNKVRSHYEQQSSLLESVNLVEVKIIVNAPIISDEEKRKKKNWITFLKSKSN